MESEQQIKMETEQQSNMHSERQIKWYQKPDMIVGLSALMVSLVAVLVGVYSAYIDRTYARASVWPRIQLGRSYGNTNFTYLAINNGTGPAIIKSLKITYDQQVVNDWTQLFTTMGLQNISYSQSQLNNIVIPANQRISALRITDKTLVETMLEQDNNISFEMCYCSIYDECWQVNKSSEIMVVEKCDLADDLQFRQ